MVGHIGDGPNDLSYMSFVRQLEAGREKGHADIELIDGVVRAIKPSCRVRAYVDACEKLTLPRLQRIIRSFYQERSATELFQDLCNLGQQSTETPQDFLFRSLALKQKLLFASKESKEGCYDAALVSQQFRRSVCTGLRGDMLRVELQHAIDSFTSDEELIEGFSEIIRRHDEAVSKRGTTVNAKVKAIESAPGVPDSALSQAVEALRLEVQELRQEVRKPCSGVDRAGKVANDSKRQSKLKSKQCEQCQGDETIRRCTHCWKCGGEGHRKWECPTQVTGETEN